ncbi:hypothetical protein EX895_004779 [Sporisorium graminicola]|uniref:DUF7888 domain-containing protein n=1 Tax=Sporisorium graminicola TaxID=280036 RepID=A0A4U7KNT9_9BASI|nr:hypothetical protein EX895_004779 [Sporisorium graminicola]TKY85954.1 hypothetical protein EX895_004779 [Sporisorium graminicola]
MQLLNLLPVPLLLSSMAYAASVETSLRQGRMECIASTTGLVAHQSPSDADAVICYHGTNTATDLNRDLTDKYSGVFGNMGYYKCQNVGIECFWMKAPNFWKGDGDGGYDNIYTILTNRCTYNRQEVSVTCTK